MVRQGPETRLPFSILLGCPSAEKPGNPLLPSFQRPEISIMKRIFFAGGLLWALQVQSQLVNNGATIVVQSGGSIFCAGSFTNTAGTVTNNGRIEVQGNFSNAGTYNSTTNDDSLILSGGGNATLNSGGAVLRFLVINKASTNDLVTLGATATVSDKLDYLSGVLSTDYLINPSYSLTAPASAVFNFAPGREIVGTVKRTGWTNGLMGVFNAANLQLTTNGGTAPTELAATVLPGAFGGDPSQAEREVKRKFLFTATGGSGFTANMRFPYLSSELNTNTEGNLVPWNLASTEWNAQLTSVSRNDVNDWVSATGIDATKLAQEWKLADPRYTFNLTAYLRGAFASGTMSNALNTGGVLPTVQPYGVAPFNYSNNQSVTIPNSNVVDWILVELRKPSSGLPADALSSTIIGRKAGFLLTNGSIVDIDGATPLNFDISKQGPSFVVVRHRNHLGVMSNSIASNTTGSFTNNFSVLANAYKNPLSTSDPLTQLPSSSAYGLWAGDVNLSGTINGTDVTAIKSDISVGNTGYRLTDANLSNSINGTDVTLTKSAISVGGSGSSPGRTAPKPVKSNLPDPTND